MTTEEGTPTTVDALATDSDFATRASNLGAPTATFQEPAVTDTDTDTGWGDDASLLPDGAGGPANDVWDEGEAQIDLGDLRINLSKEELAAESFDDMPVGKYVVAITAGKVELSKSAKNPGKPMYNLTYTVQEGKFARAKVFDRLCLWQGAAYSFTMLMKALGIPVSNGMGVPKIEQLIGRKFVMRWGMGKANTVRDPNTGEERKYEARMQVKGYFTAPNSLDQQNAALQNDPLAP
jgi:hypothetical protein